ncbi:germinal-center associated nuclear protein isoform X2 [Cygnus olor]|uniref:germinal-center associated nuclear protein isoform X2 n=1 Tax=Cygnus olor TaxID=8869 RepID=UPI001ADEA43F|nr:germinal-center associated nuclear protein isoform X2 [Cygnus olor]
MSAGPPFRGPPAFQPPPLRFGQAAVFGPGGGGAAGLPFGPAPAAFGPPFGLGQPAAFPAAGSNAGFSFKPPTNLSSFPAPGEAAAGGGGGAFAAPEFRFKAPDSAAAAAFKPLAGAEAEKGPAAPAAFTFSQPFGFAPEAAGPEPAAGGGFSFSRPAAAAAALGRPEEKGPRPLFGAAEEAGDAAPKGLKRKEERERSPRRAAVAAAGGGGRAAAAPPEKRAVLLSRPRGGALFGRTLQEVLRSQGRGHRDRGDPAEAERGPAEEPPPPVAVAEGREPPRAGKGTGGRWPPPPSRGLPARRVAPAVFPDAPPVTAGRRVRGSESTDSLGGLSPGELTAIQCKNVPDYLNDRTVLEKHFGQFVKVRRVMTRRNKKMAILHFFDHASAALAKKKAKELHKDIVTFWQKKKTSPAKREFSSKEKKAGEDEGRQSSEEQNYQHSPLRKPLIRSSASAVMPGKSSPAKKPGLRKALQFEADLFDSSSEGQNSEAMGTSLSSLSNLIGLVAETSEERYRLLDQRDKIMRQARIKRTDLGKAKTVIGTCPDMCPEKERYMRETRNQLSTFELLLGSDKVDHAAAIKEYSRSSADQEEPLPHELRPSEVLSMTMDYLVTNIMDQGEGNYREWYDFVWNRTRGIRKDITQQHLCNPLMVSLIEKCARFHIHCAHHLCEEPMSSFDAKINNENMTKCLQSLKEMYQDLANKGIYCKSEAEFRGYNVLLNLNKGDILREVQQFHPEVRNSPEVRFAVQAFAALNSNNFVRFFKLVQAASYLNACLLHCYFNQIRKDALKSLNIAYTVSTQRCTLFPLDHLVRMLLFKDCEEATHFISYYGLSVSDGAYVELNRSAFLEPDGLPKPRKSLFVSRKLTVSVGEVVNGGPLPSVPHHVPVSSFNGQSKYTGGSTSVDQASSSQKSSVEATEGRVESKGVDLDVTAVRAQPQAHLLPSLLPRPLVPMLPPVQAISQSAGQPEPLSSKPQPVYTDTDIAEVVDGLVHDVLKGECREVGRAGADYVTAAICTSEATVEELVAEVMEEVLRQVVGSTLSAERERVKEERRRVEEERQRQEREQLIKQLSQLVGMELMEEVINETVQEASANELKCALERDRQARIARCSEEVCGHVMDHFLEDEIFQIAKETLQELQCFCKYLRRWREAVAARTKLKRQMRAFPAAPCCTDPKNKLKALSPSAEWPIAMENLCRRLVNLGNGGKLGISCTRLNWLRNKTVHEIRVRHFYQQLLSDLAWTPLDLTSLITEHIPFQQEQIFWKVLLVLPNDEYAEDDLNRVLVDWFKTKFIGDKSWKKNASCAEGRIQTLTLFNSPGMQGSRSIKVSVCVKVVHGVLSDSELDAANVQKDLLGTSGLILLLPPRVRSEDVAEEDVYWLSALLQLKQLLQVKPFHPIVPLVVVVPTEEEEAIEKEVEEGLMLQDLISAQLISDYIIVELSGSINDLQGTKRIAAAVGWLVSQCPNSLKICSQTLQEYIEDGIDGEFGKRFYLDWKERRLAGLPSQEPGAIIELYNSVLQFLSDAASSEHLCDLSWPVTEFSERGGNKLLPHLHWNMPDHLAWLKKAVLSFQIPYLDLPPLGAPWRPVCHMIFQYVSQIANSSHTQPLIQSQVENLLSKTYQKWKNRTLGSSDGPSVDEIPWDAILAVCIDHKLRDWKPPKLPVAPEAVSEDGQIRVYFFKEHLQNFTIPYAWEQARLRTQEEIRQGHERSRIKSTVSFKKPRSISMMPEQNDAGMSMLLSQGRSIPSADALTDTTLAKDLLPERLLSQLQQEKMESRRFEEQLHQCLTEDTEPLGDFVGLPLYLPQSLVSTPAITGPLIKSSMPPVQGAGSQAGCELLEDNLSPILSDRLKHLQRLLRANREGEVASELHLSTLMDMVDI